MAGHVRHKLDRMHLVTLTTGEGRVAQRSTTTNGQWMRRLGFHHRLVRSRAMRGTGKFIYLARWPSRQAAQHARDRIRFMTMRARLAAPVKQVVQELGGSEGWRCRPREEQYRGTVAGVGLYMPPRTPRYTAYVRQIREAGN